MSPRGSAITKHDPSTAEGLLDVERACAYLERSRNVDEIKNLHDVAEAATLYRRSRGAALQSQNAAAEIALRCERRLGALSLELPKAQGKRTNKHPARSAGSARTTSGSVAGGSKESAQSALGLQPREARRFEKIASIPQPVFEKHVAEVKEKQQRITTSGALKVALKEAARFTVAKPKTKPAQRQFDADIAMSKTVSELSALFRDWPAGESFQPVVDMLESQLGFAKSRLKKGSK